MATIDVSSIDWEEIEEQATISKRNSGITDTIRACAKAILQKYPKMEVRQLQKMIKIALNQDNEEGDPETVINWITVKYALTNADGFKEVTKNTFEYDAGFKRAPKKTRK
jgi:hypothetical protein